MSRTDFYRACYFGASLLLSIAIGSIGWYAGPLQALFSAVGIVLIAWLGTHIQYYFWWSHFEARALLRKKLWQESLDFSLSFIQSMEQKPRLNYLVWLSYQVTSREIIAITLNNAACACMAMADYARAEDFLSRALARDSLYPMPHLNRARILIVQGLDAEAQSELETCRKLGYRNYTWSQLLHEVRSHLDGRNTLER